MTIGKIVSVHIADEALNDRLIDTARIRPTGPLGSAAVDRSVAMARLKNVREVVIRFVRLASRDERVTHNRCLPKRELSEDYFVLEVW